MRPRTKEVFGSDATGVLARLTLLGCLVTGSQPERPRSAGLWLPCRSGWGVGLTFEEGPSGPVGRQLRIQTLFVGPFRYWFLSDVIGRVTCETLPGDYKKKQEYKPPC